MTPSPNLKRIETFENNAEEFQNQNKTPVSPSKDKKLKSLKASAKKPPKKVRKIILDPVESRFRALR